MMKNFFNILVLTNFIDRLHNIFQFVHDLHTQKIVKSLQSTYPNTFLKNVKSFHWKYFLFLL